MADQNFTFETFNIYYKQAQQARDAGNYPLAKKKYAMAAKEMLTLAKGSKGELKKARLERAQKILSYAETLPNESVQPLSPVKNGRKANSEKGITENNNGAQEDDYAAMWQPQKSEGVTMDDVVGLEEAKRMIRLNVTERLKHPEIFERNFTPMPKLLLYGVPGTGKTMIAKAIANEIDAPFFVVPCSDIRNKYVGESEKIVKGLFDKAKSFDRAIIYIDEMDALFKSRSSDTSDFTNSLVNTFLQEIDGFKGTENLIIMGATNYPDRLDPAVLRQGRFGTHIRVDLPNEDAREQMMQKRLKGKNSPVGITCREIAQKTEGYSGADLNGLANSVKSMMTEKYIRSCDEGNKPNPDDFTHPDAQTVLEAIEKSRPTVMAESFEALDAFEKKFSKK